MLFFCVLLKKKKKKKKKSLTTEVAGIPINGMNSILAWALAWLLTSTRATQSFPANVLYRFSQMHFCVLNSVPGNCLFFFKFLVYDEHVIYMK